VDQSSDVRDAGPGFRPAEGLGFGEMATTKAVSFRCATPATKRPASKAERKAQRSRNGEGSHGSMHDADVEGTELNARHEVGDQRSSSRWPANFLVVRLIVLASPVDGKVL
jgi:hypothetical protein